MTTLVIVLLAVTVLVVLGGLSLLAMANRLDRLHVRTDAGWAALVAALERRAALARAVAAALPDKQGGDLRTAATEPARAEARWEREARENLVTEFLTTMDGEVVAAALMAELADSQHRVIIARRVYNDAVRDTLALRRRRVVRYFRLAGTAPLPEYFEIVEPELASSY